MKPLILITIALFISTAIFSQTKIENIKKGYLVSFGILPEARQIAQLKKNKKMDATSVNQVINYLNNYIFLNRETLQKDIIRRAFISVFKAKPNNQDVEALYASTDKKCKNYTALINELSIYFTDDINLPD